MAASRHGRPELAQGEDREGVGPGERGGRAGDAGAGVDPLGQGAGRGGGAAQGGEQAQGAGDRVALRRRRLGGERGEAPGGPGGRRGPGVVAPCQSSPGTIPKRRPLAATSRSRVARTAGKSAGRGNGRTAQAAAESRPEPGLRPARDQARAAVAE